MDILCKHEAGHCVVATALGYPARALVNSQGGATFYGKPMAKPMHFAALALAGALGELIYDSPKVSLEQAHKWIVESKRVSKQDWEVYRKGEDHVWGAMQTAIDALTRHHSALVRIASILERFGEINPFEVEAIWQTTTGRKLPATPTRPT